MVQSFEIMSKKKEEIGDVFNLKDTPKEEAIIPDVPKDESSIESTFEVDRKKWKDIVLKMANMINDIHKIGELQVELYSNRQICLEHNHFLMSILAKMQKEYRKKLGQRWDNYMTSHDRKMKMGEANVQVESSLSNEKEKIESLEYQIQYFQETIRNIDNIIYGIRYRINVEEFRR